MKIVFKFVLLFVLVYILGQRLWPFFAYLTGVEMIFLRYLCYYTSIIIFTIGLIWLIISSIKRSNTRIPSYLITISCAIFLSFFTIKKYYEKHGRYVGEYIKLCDKSSYRYGLANKFGVEFIEPKYKGVVKAFETKSKEYVYIGIDKNSEKTDTIDNKPAYYYSYVLYLHDEDGDMKQIIDIKENDCDHIDEYIEKYIGKVIENYGYHFAFNAYMLKTENEHTKKDSEYTETDNKMNTSNQESEEEVIIRHVHESSEYSGPEYATRDVWVDCMECHGTGKCKYCQGTGKCWYGNSYEDCVTCHGSTNCQICYGTRGHYEKQTYQIR